MRSISSFLGLGVIAFLFFGIMVFSLFIYKEDSSVKAYKYSYKVVQYNPQTNIYKHGASKLLTELKKDEYITYENEIGGHTLISNFGSKEYKCIGSCYCGEESRRNALTIRSGIIYLVAAFSSSVAFVNAQKHFKQECKNEMSSHCSDTVFSDIQRCDEIEEEVIERKNRYRCGGDCLLVDDYLIRNEYHDRNQKVLEQMKRGCKEFAMEREIVIALTEEEAIDYFGRYILNNHCTRISRYFLDEGDHGIDDKSICVGTKTFFKNPTIECKFVGEIII